MQLRFCDNCKHWCGELIQIPNRETGVADVYCGDCLPEKYKEALEKHKEDIDDKEEE